MITNRTLWVSLANILWAVHFVVVLLVVSGFLVQFFIPQIAKWELYLIGIVMILQFAWFGDCPVTKLEDYLRKKADSNYQVSKDGCISDAIFNIFKFRAKGIWISIAGAGILAVTILVYVMRYYWS